MKTVPSGRKSANAEKKVETQSQIKKVTVNMNLKKNIASGRVTPLKSNRQTPRDHSISYYTKSICHTEEGSFNGTPTNRKISK